MTRGTDAGPLARRPSLPGNAASPAGRPRRRRRRWKLAAYLGLLAVLARTFDAAQVARRARRGPWRAEVAEESMAPALLPGDWLLLDPTIRRWPRPGTIVVVREPGTGILAIKRVAARGHRGGAATPAPGELGPTSPTGSVAGPGARRRRGDVPSGRARPGFSATRPRARSTRGPTALSTRTTSSPGPGSATAPSGESAGCAADGVAGRQTHRPLSRRTGPRNHWRQLPSPTSRPTALAGRR